MSNIQNVDKGIAAAIGRIPSGLFILTAVHETKRTGALVSWVQQVGFKPPTISVAVGQDRPVMGLIEGSRRFALCQVPQEDKVLLRKFAAGVPEGEDPFADMPLVETSDFAVPVLADSLSYMTCELAAHVVVQTDHDLIIGTVVAGALNGDGEPFVHLRENGLKY